MAEVVPMPMDASVMERIDEMIDAPDAALAAPAPARARARELLDLGEAILERWLVAHGITPTQDSSEGFRLLALHRQGAKGDPSFNACRETCRELVYHHNLIQLAAGQAEAGRRVRLGAMVARHLALFVGGKLEVAGLGEFCCSSRPLRERETPPLTATLGE